MLLVSLVSTGYVKVWKNVEVGRIGQVQLDNRRSF